MEDNEMDNGYVLDGEPKTIDDIEKVFKTIDLESKFELFKPLIRSKIDFELVESNDNKIKIGQSKIGGKPDLLATSAWPITNDNKSLSFIGQLNCAELKSFDVDNLLPNEGLLSFFYCSEQEAWGFDPKDADRFNVIYTDSIDNLERIDYPKDLEEFSIFQPNELKFASSLSLPGWEHDSIEGVLSDDQIDNYIDINCGADNQIFGYANCIQGPMELECQLVTNGLYCGDSSGYEDPKIKEVESGKEDWILLLQIDSEEENAGMMWGDSGKLYYWIKKQDLKDKNFDKSWFVLQCY